MVFRRGLRHHPGFDQYLRLPRPALRPDNSHELDAWFLGGDCPVGGWGLVWWRLVAVLGLWHSFRIHVHASRAGTDWHHSRRLSFISWPRPSIRDLARLLTGAPHALRDGVADDPRT